ncbi:hypothetical protein GIY23_13000 [Allosaccharopolyspora coralli]|uniref:Uncharacterized protein n=1 Tax=Allosaccharopolyspora coralli TaxID=2665642 RepID=A0A5Q3QG90_9PSEU|nr:hypothetical protein GIY23_13000 [Allosaccharopolyspora coralli]
MRRPRPARARRGRWARPLLLTVVVFGVLVSATGTAHAETTEVLAVAPNLQTVLNNIRNWVMGLLALIATVFLTIGGVRYITANGDPGEIGKAKEAFKNAAIGFGLAALAPVVVDILTYFVGGL